MVWPQFYATTTPLPVKSVADLEILEGGFRFGAVIS